MTEKLRIRDGSMRRSASDYSVCDNLRRPKGQLPNCQSRSWELSLLQRQERLRKLRADVVGARPDEAVVRVLFEAVRRPARHAAHREDRREQIDWNAERVV